MLKKLNAIKELKDEIEYLENAEEILQSVWFELGAYSHVLSDELMIRMQRHYGFDDSE